jgi:hypothetical protein
MLHRLHSGLSFHKRRDDSKRCRVACREFKQLGVCSHTKAHLLRQAVKWDGNQWKWARHKPKHKGRLSRHRSRTNRTQSDIIELTVARGDAGMPLPWAGVGFESFDTSSSGDDESNSDAEEVQHAGAIGECVSLYLIEQFELIQLLGQSVCADVCDH